MEFLQVVTCCCFIGSHATMDPMARQRAPRGWRRVTWVRVCQEGAKEDRVLVCTPKNGAVRKKSFRPKVMAYLGDGVIHVKYPKTWDDPEIRMHELEHLKQERMLGAELFEYLYVWAHRLVGYKGNPFEVAAFKAGKRAKARSRRRSKASRA